MILRCAVRLEQRNAQISAGDVTKKPAYYSLMLLSSLDEAGFYGSERTI
jgi:hypothetical protein